MSVTVVESQNEKGCKETADHHHYQTTKDQDKVEQWEVDGDENEYQVSSYMFFCSALLWRIWTGGSKYFKVLDWGSKYSEVFGPRGFKLFQRGSKYFSAIWSIWTGRSKVFGPGPFFSWQIYDSPVIAGTLTHTLPLYLMPLLAIHSLFSCACLLAFSHLQWRHSVMYGHSYKDVLLLNTDCIHISTTCGLCFI